MSKKVAQNTIDFKKDEINKAVNDALTNLNTKLQESTRQMNEKVTQELNNIVNNLSKEVEVKVNEIKSLVPAQQAADDKIKDRLKGGEADNISEDKVNKKQLDMGQKVEMEHTDDPEIAREIARDHLSEELKEGKEKEDQTYYTDLRKMHKDSVYDLPGAVKEAGEVIDFNEAKNRLKFKQYVSSILNDYENALKSYNEGSALVPIKKLLAMRTDLVELIEEYTEYAGRQEGENKEFLNDTVYRFRENYEIINDTIHEAFSMIDKYEKKQNDPDDDDDFDPDDPDDGEPIPELDEEPERMFRSAKKKKKKKKSKHSLEPMMDHPTPRDGEHNKDLPDFWRRNFDYGESPYMNIGFIEKITDKPPYKKKKKRKKSRMLMELVSMADILDRAGLTDAANKIDALIKEAATHSHLIRALKSGNAEDIRKTLTNFIRHVPQGSTPSQELGMTDKDYKEFVDNIQRGLNLDRSKELFGFPVPNFNNALKDYSSIVNILKNSKHVEFGSDPRNIRGVIAEYTNPDEKEDVVKNLVSTGFQRRQAHSARYSSYYSKDISDNCRVTADVDVGIDEWADHNESSIGVIPGAPAAPNHSIALDMYSKGGHGYKLYDKIKEMMSNQNIPELKPYDGYDDDDY